jgi:hypothetical protein
MPWAPDQFRGAQFIELDASFRAVRPYVYCVALGIRCNESFPLALVVAPTESAELYNLFFNSMVRYGLDPAELHGKPYLTDHCVFAHAPLSLPEAFCGKIWLCVVH